MSQSNSTRRRRVGGHPAGTGASLWTRASEMQDTLHVLDGTISTRNSENLSIVLLLRLLVGKQVVGEVDG
jgi:hypothetical protein